MFKLIKNGEILPYSSGAVCVCGGGGCKPEPIILQCVVVNLGTV
jgi:hypothetical protein